MQITIDFVGDYICPWCYLGLVSFERAKALISDIEIVTRIRPYLLNPEIPPGGLDRAQYIEQKFPDKARQAAISEALKQTAAEIHAPAPVLTAPKRLPDTAKMHAIVQVAHVFSVQEETAALFYSRYWIDGDDLDQDDVLVDIAEAAGVPLPETKAALNDASLIAACRADSEAIHRAGVKQAPTFIVNEKVGFPGVLSPDKLSAAIQQAAEAA
ncbi:MAG: DsbA family protein [Pseudomonadota bacterium]